MWNKPWGAKRMTRAQKANRRAAALRAEQNREVLRAAALLEPAPGSAEAVRLERPLAAWRQRQMAGHLARARRALEDGRGVEPLLPPSPLLAGGGAAAGGGAGSFGRAGGAGGARPYGSVAAAAAAAGVGRAAAAAAAAAGTAAASGAGRGGGWGASAWAWAARAMTAIRR